MTYDPVDIIILPTFRRIIPYDDNVSFNSRGRKFIGDHLPMEDVQSYWKRLLKKCGKLIKWKN